MRLRWPKDVFIVLYTFSVENNIVSCYNIIRAGHRRVPTKAGGCHMKIIGNAGAFFYLARTIASLGDYKKRIDSLKARGESEEERQVISEVCRYWSDKVVKYLDLTIDIKNPQYLPQNGPVVYVANHQSYADILVFLNITKHQIGFIAKEELTKIPMFSSWTTRIESLFIKRGDARASLMTINEGADMLRNGYSLVIFPEGTRSRSGRMGEFKQGSLKLATRAKAVVVPVTLNGTYKVFEETGKISKGQRVEAVIHEPIDTSKLDRKEQSELSGRLEEIVRSGLV